MNLTPTQIIKAEIERRRHSNEVETPIIQRSQVLDRLMVTQIMAEFEPIARLEQGVEGATNAARAAQSHAVQLQGAVKALVNDLQAESTRANNFHERLLQLEISVRAFGMRLDSDAVARRLHSGRIKVLMWSTGATILGVAIAVWKFFFPH